MCFPIWALNYVSIFGRFIKPIPKCPYWIWLMLATYEKERLVSLYCLTKVAEYPPEYLDYQVCVKGFFDIFLFPTLFWHMRQAEVDCFSFFWHGIWFFSFYKLLAWTSHFNLMFSHHAILLRSAKWPTSIWKPHLLLLCCSDTSLQQIDVHCHPNLNSDCHQKVPGCHRNTDRV